MYSIIPKVTFNEIQEDIKRIMATIGLFSFEESFLAVDENIDPRITFKTILERSNATFSRHFPLLFIQRIFFAPGDKFYTFVDNFDLYLAGNLDPEFINLVPDTVVSISTVRHFHAKWGFLSFTYQPPYLIPKYPVNGNFFAKTLCKYRIHFNPNNRDDDAVYYINKTTPIYDIFIKQIVYDISFFMLSAKNNYQITDLPIEIFGGLEEISNLLRDELETLYAENPRNYLIYY